MFSVPSGPSASDFESGRAHNLSIKNLMSLYIGGLAAIYFLLVVVNWSDLARLAHQIWFFGPVGVVGALIANATGAGGGVVFIPFFNALSPGVNLSQIATTIQITPKSAIGISFLIQCFGMSVGACVWLLRLYSVSGEPDRRTSMSIQDFATIILVVLSTTLPSLLISQRFLFNQMEGGQILWVFKIFSLALGIALLYISWKFRNDERVRTEIVAFDYCALVVIGIAGGFVTAFFSVGVGELLACYLIWRRFPTKHAIAVAVIVSAVTVVSGVPFYVENDHILWPVALAAIPGAIAGGYLSRILVDWLGAFYLKVFAASWIVLSSAVLLLMPMVGLGH